MTRENKLALVVGFVLILLVGILVSDHFSVARSQQSADLLPEDDPMSTVPSDDPALLQFAAPKPTRPQPLLVNTPPAEREAQTLRMPDIQSNGTIRLDEAQARALPFSFHQVRSGESLTTICRDYYGDDSLTRELAEYNGLDDPDQLTVGRRLRIPAASELVRGRPAPKRVAMNRPGTPVDPSTATYTVKAGDVLSVIAQRTMGSAKHWRKLYDHNRDVIDDPDRLKVGTVLKLPTGSSR